MLRRSLLVLALSLAVLVASWGCASRPSHGDPQGLGVGSGTPQAVHSQLEQQLAALATQLATEFSAHQVNRIAVLPFENTTGQDRKSTRLNSSHVAISYAVFCLKKKIGLEACCLRK